jgi:hypothetical protein
MEDCRAFTDYNPNCALNEHIKTKHGIVNSTEYRLFLQRNACQIMGDLKQNSQFDNPTGCKCNYNHPPHDYEHDLTNLCAVQVKESGNNIVNLFNSYHKIR